MPDAETTEAPAAGKKWFCTICRNHHIEYSKLGLRRCTGRPLSYYTIGREKTLVCENGARFHLFDQGRKHERILQSLAELSGIRGRVRQTLLQLLTVFKRERIKKLSGDLNPHDYEHFLADSLASWRFIVCGSFLEGAKAALTEMNESMPEDKVSEVTALIEVSESDMRMADLNPADLDRRDRSKRWGAAKRSFIFLVGDEREGLPPLSERIRTAAGLDKMTFRREFMVRQLMYAFHIDREEAEKVANEELMGGIEKALRDKTDDSAVEPKEEVAVKSSEVDEGSPTETIADLPDKVRIIQAGKRIAAPKKEQDRARKLLERYGGQIWATKVDEDAPLSAKELERRLLSSAANGGPKVSRRGQRREEPTA